ncbi:transposable element Tcb2 transposase [Trichonephila clavipes]|nr:transposable element Tcb2 transposase [Trichonephila clavipes]
MSNDPNESTKKHTCSMTSRKRMEDSERWLAVGRIEAGQWITDVTPFFGIHSVISRVWKQFQTTQTVVRRPASGQAFHSS